MIDYGKPIAVDVTSMATVRDEPSISSKFSQLEASLSGLEDGLIGLNQMLDPVSLRNAQPEATKSGPAPTPVVSPMESRLDTLLARVFCLREQVETTRRQLRI